MGVPDATEISNFLFGGGMFGLMLKMSGDLGGIREGLKNLMDRVSKLEGEEA